MYNLFRRVASFEWGYAIREIILIVVGILIALTINNWNEKRKLYQKETEILREIKVSLNNDLIDIEINKDLHEAGLRSTNILLNHLKQNKAYHDTLDVYFGQDLNASLFLSDDNAYNSLQNYGREIISNDSLRSKLAILYAHDYAFIKKLEEVDNLTLTNHFQPYYFKHFKDFKLFETATPRDYSFLVHDSKYIEMLEWWKSSRIYSTTRYNLIDKKVRDIIQMIDEELASRS